MMSSFVLVPGSRGQRGDHGVEVDCALGRRGQPERRPSAHAPFCSHGVAFWPLAGTMVIPHPLPGDSLPRAGRWKAWRDRPEISEEPARQPLRLCAHDTMPWYCVARSIGTFARAHCCPSPQEAEYLVNVMWIVARLREPCLPHQARDLLVLPSRLRVHAARHQAAAFAAASVLQI